MGLKNPANSMQKILTPILYSTDKYPVVLFPHSVFIEDCFHIFKSVSNQQRKVNGHTVG